MRADVIGELQGFKAVFFKALAHPVRIRILERLVRRDHSVQELQLALGIGQPGLSQQLGILRANNIVVGRKAGVSVRYAVRDPLIRSSMSPLVQESVSFAGRTLEASSRPVMVVS